MTDVANIKRKIFNLLQKTVENGCSEEEAMTAAEKAGELLEFYSLNLHDVVGYDINQEKFIEKYIQTESKNTPIYSGCLPALARYCNVKMWIGNQNNKVSFGVFGLVCDVEVFEYLYAIIKSCYDNEVENFKKTSMEYKVAGKSNGFDRLTRQRIVSKKSLLHSFSMGFVQGLRNRLQELAVSKNNHLNESRKGTSIVVLKDEMLVKGFNKYSSVAGQLKTVTTHRAGIRSNGSYNTGFNAGKNVSLNCGVNSSNKGYLTA